MLQNDKVRLRAINRDDLPALARFNNDLEVELAGGGDPPWPQALERLTAEFETKWSHGSNDRAIRAYRACGFKEEGRQQEQVWSNGRYDDLVHMGILRRDWLQQQG